MDHVGALRYEERARSGCNGTRSEPDAVAPDVGLDAIEHRDEIVRPSDDRDRNRASSAEAVACAAQIGHGSSLSGQGYSTSADAITRTDETAAEDTATDQLLRLVDIDVVDQTIALGEVDERAQRALERQ